MSWRVRTETTTEEIVRQPTCTARSQTIPIRASSVGVWGTWLPTITRRLLSPQVTRVGSPGKGRYRSTVTRRRAEGVARVEAVKPPDGDALGGSVKAVTAVTGERLGVSQEAKVKAEESRKGKAEDLRTGPTLLRKRRILTRCGQICWTLCVESRPRCVECAMTTRALIWDGHWTSQSMLRRRSHRTCTPGGSIRKIPLKCRILLSTSGTQLGARPRLCCVVSKCTGTTT